MRTLFLTALGVLCLTACQTTEKVTDDAAEGVEDAADATAQVARGAADTAEDAAQDAARGAEDAGQAVVDAAGSAWSAARDVFDEDEAAYAVALVRPTTAPGAGAQGTVSLRESDGGLMVSLSLSGLRPGPHAVHVHENPACGPGEDGTPGGAAGGHWDPLDSDEHGAPTDPLDAKHLGDFGNFEAGPDGTAEVVVAVAPFPTEEVGVTGHAVIVHEGRDDLASDPAGDAGSRVGCGVLEARDL